MITSLPLTTPMPTSVSSRSLPMAAVSMVVEITLTTKEDFQTYDNVTIIDGTSTPTITTVEQKYKLRLTLPSALSSTQIKSLNIKLNHQVPSPLPLPSPAAPAADIPSLGTSVSTAASNTATAAQSCYPITPQLDPSSAAAAHVVECCEKLELQQRQLKQMGTFQQHLRNQYRNPQTQAQAQQIELPETVSSSQGCDGSIRNIMNDADSDARSFPLHCLPETVSSSLSHNHNTNDRMPNKKRQQIENNTRKTRRKTRT